MKTKHVRPVLVESKDIHSQLEIDTISIGKLSIEQGAIFTGKCSMISNQKNSIEQPKSIETKL